MTKKEQLGKAADAFVQAQVVESVVWAWGVAAAVVFGIFYLVGRALYLAWH
jgi:predicted secreted protein